MNKKEHFIKFLLNNDCYNNYCSNLIYLKSKTLEEQLSNGSIYDIIDDSFCWQNTAEQSNYWLNIDKKWNVYYKNCSFEKNKKLLIDFLRKHRILTKYKKNLRSNSHRYNYNKIDDLVLNAKLERYINGAFDWGLNGNSNLWMSLNIKWFAHLSNIGDYNV